MMKLKMSFFTIFMMVAVVAYSQTYGNMNYRTEKRNNSDGTVTYTRYSDCWSCRGSKSCSMCRGQGGMMSGYGMYARYNVCPICHGNGKCSKCYGSGGQVISSYTTLPDDKFDNVNYIKLHNGYSEVAYSKNHITRITYTQCATCHGTQKCTMCHGQGGKNYGGYSSPHYITCTMCNGTTLCSRCDYRGMVKVITTIDFETGAVTYHNETTGFCSVDYIDVSSFSNGYNDAFSLSADDEYRGKLSPEQYREHYARWENQARSCYEDLVDIVKSGNGSDLHINKHKADESVVYQSGMRTLLIRIQGEMRKVRSEAASYGVIIGQSQWETCSPPSRY